MLLLEHETNNVRYSEELPLGDLSNAHNINKKQ